MTVALKKLLAVPLMLSLSGGCATTREAAAPGAAAARAASTDAPAQAPAQGEATPDARFDALAEAFFEEVLVLNPWEATFIGDERYNDRSTVGFAKEERAQARALAEKTLAALKGIDPAALSAQRAVSHDMLRLSLEQDLEGERFPGHLIPLNQFFSFAGFFAQAGSGKSAQPFKTVKDYDNWLKRAAGWERTVDVAIANMREGAAAGVVQPKVVMEKVLPQLSAHVVEDPTKSVFWGPVTDMPKDFPAPERERLTAAYRQLVGGTVVPGYKRLHDFIRDEYLPKARTTVGYGALPDGQAWYAYQVRQNTTTDLTAEQIHQLGLSEVKRIHGEMQQVQRQLGAKGDLQAFLRKMATDKAQKFTSREEMLEAYRNAQARIDASTDKAFDVKPKANYEIRPVEPYLERSASGGSYEPASLDGSRPGVFFLNTYEPTGRSRNAVESLLMHEGSPGHHFQISLARELEALPRFRRFGFYTAYVEGWALYAETLGKELGLYQDPGQYFGALESELWRSIRLVLDTGLHAKGWTREQAIRYARENSAASEVQIVSEVERFIAVPGQALAYKMGQLKITELRRRAEKALGARFDVKAFHRAVLEDGAVPLSVLERKLDRWVAAQGQGQARAH
jgi:uncharacterized protein (DUF885 family)